jgi:hypothetical protein
MRGYLSDVNMIVLYFCSYERGDNRAEDGR